MTTVHALLKAATAEFLAAGASDARLDAEWLLAHVLGIERLSLLVSRERPVPDADQARFETLTARRSAGEPLQYILGTQAFMGHTFQVTPHVLIPRQDTETLCEAAIAWLNGRALNVLDIGTGSGALAISMKLACPDARVTAIDISAEALRVAMQNAQCLGAEIRFLQGDLTQPVAGATFDLIVSNPPYLTAEDLSGLQREVRAEPLLALDGGPDGLAFYRALAPAMAACLAPGGICMLEVGQGQAEDVAALLSKHIGPAQTIRDLCGVERVVCAAASK